MSDLKTKLYDTHISLGGHMVSFGGYLLPTHFSGINHEHEIVRSKVGLFDVSHMGEFIISGCLLYTSPSPRDRTRSRMPSSA